MRVWLLLFGLAICGCNGSVGSDDCFGKNIRCVAPLLPDAQWNVTEVSTRDLEQVTPVWSQDPFSEDGAVTLISDAEDRVWLFRSTQDVIEVETRDRDGAVLEESVLQAPKGVRGPPYVMHSENESFGGPSVGIAWGPETRLEPAPVYEWIKFGSGPEDIRERLQSPPGSKRADNRDVTWREDGGVYLISASGAVQHRNRAGELVWSQNGWNNTTNPTAATAIARAADGNIAVIAGAKYVLDGDGNFIPEESGTLPFGTDDSAVTRQDLNGFTITSEAFQGDLGILRDADDPDEFSIVQVLREDFAALEVSTNTVDPYGNVYVVSRIGGREPDDRFDILCRVPTEADPSCVALERERPRLYTIAALSDGVLIGLSDNRLERFDYPE